MRFKKGDKVEVMNRKEAPASWRVAEILSGNGRTYRVEYHSYPGTTCEEKVETVPRKFVRPCPPLVQGVQSYVAGDIVEVFSENSWKIAAILKVLVGKEEHKSNKILVQDAPGNLYIVRLLGCSMDLIVDQSNIRLRQTWHGENWIMMTKSSQGGKDVIASEQGASNYYQKMTFQVPEMNARAEKELQKYCTNIQDYAAFRDSPMISSRSLKRMSPYGSSVVEAHNEHTQKLRAIEKGGKKQRVIAAPMLEKVDAVSYPGEILGQKNMHASFNITSNGYNQIERAKPNDFVGCFGVRSSQSSSSDSDDCSVGSCSVTNQSQKKCYIPFKSLPSQMTDTLCSDAESHYGSSSERKSSSVPAKEEVEFSIRRLELHAYRRTLEALYASGPLSWEQEALLTNLRIMLNISNDVHLLELKQLTSAKTTTKVR